MSSLIEEAFIVLKNRFESSKNNSNLSKIIENYLKHSHKVIYNIISYKENITEIEYADYCIHIYILLKIISELIDLI